jgi:isochorismate synthase
MNTTVSVSSRTLAETDYFSLILDHAFQNQFSVAVWKLPNDATRHLIVSRKHQLLKREAALEELPEGFIVAPFDRSKDSLFLQADYIFSFTDQALKPAESPREIASVTWLQELIKSAPQHGKQKPYFLPTALQDDDKQFFMNVVNAGVREIEKNTLEKVVPSRTRSIDLPAEFDIIQAFQKLCHTNPNALVSFVSSPETGSWLGASPEALVSVENKTLFKTVALAGTKSYQEGTNLKTVAWTQKEIEEQALVERYVISCFKKIRVREYEEHGPKTIVAGNLLHLKSDFTVDMKAINFPQLGSVMLQLLHPTSAVCGMPLEPALEFLKQHEGYDREFYAGFLGPVNISNNINIFVNIRCMKLLEGKAVVYAGAGVTLDSVPEHEWAETEMKFNTLLNVIAAHA